MNTNMINSIRTQKRNLNEINDKVLYLKVIPALKRESENEFNKTQIEFKWDVKSYKGDTLVLKLNWTYPLYISPLAVQDSL